VFLQDIPLLSLIFSADLIPGDSSHDWKTLKKVKQEAPEVQVIEQGQMQMLLAIQQQMQQMQQQEQLLLLQQHQRELEQLVLLQQQQEEQFRSAQYQLYRTAGAPSIMQSHPHLALHETLSRTTPALMPIEIATLPDIKNQLAELAYTACHTV
jgi:hypothetical protein